MSRRAPLSSLALMPSGHLERRANDSLNGLCGSSFVTFGRKQPASAGAYEVAPQPDTPPATTPRQRVARHETAPYEPPGPSVPSATASAQRGSGCSRDRREWPNTCQPSDQRPACPQGCHAASPERRSSWTIPAAAQPAAIAGVDPEARQRASDASSPNQTSPLRSRRRLRPTSSAIDVFPTGRRARRAWPPDRRQNSICICEREAVRPTSEPRLLGKLHRVCASWQRSPADRSFASSGALA